MPPKPAVRPELKQKMLESLLLKTISEHPDENITINQVVSEASEKMPVDTTTVMKFFRQFLQQGQIRVIQADDGKNTYRYIPDDLSDKFVNLSEQAHKIYTLIEQSGDAGIWRRDLKKKSGLEDKQIMTILKDLESRLLIKTTPSIHEKKRLLYILYDITPSAAVTGGLWYSAPNSASGLFNTLIPPLRAQFRKQIEQGEDSRMTRGMLNRMVTTSGVGNRALSEENAKQVITAATCAGVIVQHGLDFIPGPAHPLVDPVSKIPCRGCPLSLQCEPGGDINPIDCPYMKRMAEYL